MPEMLKPFIGKTMQDITVNPEGHLRMTFVDSSQWSVWSATTYEAWEVHGPHGELVVCQVGGELAVWGPRAE